MNRSAVSSLEELVDSLPGKVSWEELCERVSATDSLTRNHNLHRERNGDYDGAVGPDRPAYATRQLLGLFGAQEQRYVMDPALHGTILRALRPEDSTHVPQLRVDGAASTITDWNRSMIDLTGMKRSDVVGKAYVDVLNEWAPQLSEGYKRAASDWIARESRAADDDNGAEMEATAEDRRERYLFPLPLPIKDGSAAHEDYAGDDCCDYVELLVARADNLSKLYPAFAGLPKYGSSGSWAYDTRGWLGGTEFTLRRRQALPSLQDLCRRLVPQGVFNRDGSARAGATPAPLPPAPSSASTTLSVSEAVRRNPSQWGNRMPEGECRCLIRQFLRRCSSAGVEYFREILWNIRTMLRKKRASRSTYSFSANWGENEETAGIHQIVLCHLGGRGILRENTTGDGRLTWNLATGIRDERTRNEWQQMCRRFLNFASRAVGESKFARPACLAFDTPHLIPGTKPPERQLLTLKIDGVERCTNGSRKVELFKAWAIVQVPATLNFFQLHRVVTQTMNCSNDCINERNTWKACNVASSEERPVTKLLDYIQVGDTCHGIGLFEKGCAIRQRVSRTGASCDQPMPLWSKNMTFLLKPSDESVQKVCAYAHSTCISSLFFRPEQTVLLQEGVKENMVKYKLSCTRIDAFDGLMPRNPSMNTMQPKCLRGKPEVDDQDWSVERANAQLGLDRGCLRRNLCKIGSPDCMEQMPWCSREVECVMLFDRTEARKPLAMQLKGMDKNPVILYGQPTLPGCAGYRKYISSLHGRISHGMHSFPYGNCVRAAWTDEVDEELLFVKTSSRGKKRKAGKIRA